MCASEDPYKTVNLLLTNLLGGSIYQEDETKHEITNIDHKVLSIVFNSDSVEVNWRVNVSYSSLI